ncbi:MAG: PAS domain-containing protein [Spirochaetia bacterium]|nr:PAS domain-containing protein [Spirochaetia bacterium]
MKNGAPIEYSDVSNKLWGFLNSFVSYSIDSKKNRPQNWLIFISTLIISLLPYIWILLKQPYAEVIIQILYWQAAIFFLSNLLLPIQFSLVILLIHFSIIAALPRFTNQLFYQHIFFVLLLLTIVHALTYAFTKLRQWDIEHVRESVRLLAIKQNRIDTLFDNEFYAILIHQNGKIHDINETFTTIFQYSLNEIKDADFYDILLKDVLVNQNKLISTLKEFSVETYGYRKNGDKVPIEIIGKTYKEQGENFQICFIRDITGKREMYEEISHHRNYLQKILDALPHAIFVRDLKTMSIQKANKLALEDYNPVSIPYGFGHHEEIDRTTEYQRGLELVLKTKLPLTIEESHHFENSAEKYVEIYLYPFLDDRGEIIELLEIIMNITERKKIENRLKSTLKELRDMRDALDEHAIVSITDPLGNITYVNERFVEVSGFSRRELIGENHRINRSDHYPRGYHKRIWDSIANGKVWQGELENKAKNGNYYWVFTTIVPFLDEHNQIYQYVSIRTEITEQKRITSELREAKEEAERANQAKSVFLANMSHEIRTPLNAVLGMAELTLSTGLTQTQKKYLSLIQSSGENLLNIINEILDFSKIEAGKLVIENADFQLRCVLFSMLHIFMFQAKEKNLNMSMHIDPEIPDHLIGDQQRIRQILINLIGNSLKFTETGYIIIHVEACNYSIDSESIVIKFTVADSGIGIPVSKQKLIFESFTQEDSSTTRKYGGTGLGTTISRELTAKMGGEMGVISPLRYYSFNAGGPGSEFWFTVKCGVNLEQEKLFIDNLKEKNFHVFAYISISQTLDTVQRILESFHISLTVRPPEEIIRASDEISANTDLILVEMPGQVEQLALMLTNFSDNPKVTNFTRIVTIVDDDETLDTYSLYEMGIIYLLYKPVTEKSILRMFSYIEHSRQDSAISDIQPSEKNTLPLFEINDKTGTKQDCRGNILIVEDNEINQFLLKTILESIQCCVFIANNGLESIKLLSEDPDYFDLVFMDLQMPEMNGFNASGEIRKNISKTLPIVAVSANAFLEDREKSILCGMNEFLAKPYTKENLISIVDKYIKK